MTLVGYNDDIWIDLNGIEHRFRQCCRGQQFGQGTIGAKYRHWGRPPYVAAIE